MSSNTLPGEVLFSNFNRLKKSLFRFFDAHAEKTEGLKQSEIFMLMRFAHQRCAENNISCEGIRISDLSRMSHSSMPAVSQIIRSLEDKGYVVRKTSQKDRRAVFVTLTEKGEVFIKAAPQAVTGSFSEICDQLGTEKTLQLITLTDELCAVIEAYTTTLKETDTKGTDHD